MSVRGAETWSNNEDGFDSSSVGLYDSGQVILLWGQVQYQGWKSEEIAARGGQRRPTPIFPDDWHSKKIIYHARISVKAEVDPAELLVFQKRIECDLPEDERQFWLQDDLWGVLHKRAQATSHEARRGRGLARLLFRNSYRLHANFSDRESLQPIPKIVEHLQSQLQAFNPAAGKTKSPINGNESQETEYLATPDRSNPTIRAQIKVGSALQRFWVVLFDRDHVGRVAEERKAHSSESRRYASLLRLIGSKRWPPPSIETVCWHYRHLAIGKEDRRQYELGEVVSLLGPRKHIFEVSGAGLPYLLETSYNHGRQSRVENPRVTQPIVEESELWHLLIIFRNRESESRKCVAYHRRELAGVYLVHSAQKVLKFAFQQIFEGSGKPHNL